MDLLRKYLLSSVLMAPPDRSGVSSRLAAGADDGADDQGADDDQGGADDGADDQGADDDQGGADDQGADDDQGGADDQGADDDQGGAGDQGADDPPARRGRTRETARVQALNERTRAAEQAARDALARVDALQTQMQQRLQPQETPEQEAERLALMTPEQRTEYKVTKALNAHTQRTDNVMAQLRDNADRAAFSAKLAAEPRFKSYAPEVEARLATIRKTGADLPREAVLIYLLGEKVINSKGAPQQRKNADARVQRQQTRPSNGRGDVRNDRRPVLSNLEKRLENVPI